MSRSGTPRPRAVGRRAPRVLMYHFFGDVPAGADPAGLFVRPEALAEQLRWLRGHGWRALTLDEYLAALDGALTPRRSYLLTIDDAHESVLRIAAPLLAAAGVPAVLYVPAGLLGGRVTWSSHAVYGSERLLDAQQVRELARAGVEIGVHGHDHTRLRGLSAADLAPHVTGARDLLATVTGGAPRTFAYPYGTWDEASRRAVAEAGYLAAFAVARRGGRFAVDRIGVSGTDSLLVFRFKLSLSYRLLSRAAGRAWRLRHAVRRVVARGGT
ncbi:polysaccharide deacetylase family protein [Streptomyces spinosirectus]|uniref:polysaccharide deacetylase family protein n=1 Tax=Streptomyces TaxID=1883 RepID=UPI000D3C32DF|nr:MULTISPECIES: polysaccharide deacetylase family protein [Streptomyces]MBY8338492.1 polysaccharide deacetylase family protein [Streptomyces plumbidurans]PTM96811.1 polysaccharide deacetylase [Streptomyces sp. VMFN-G11Ma]UIR16374.1 polysaccharide deacetylase family protein [Streptomyces spinosirectus]